MDQFNLCSLIYYYIKQKVRFGIYKKGEKLPKSENNNEQLEYE